MCIKFRLSDCLFCVWQGKIRVGEDTLRKPTTDFVAGNVEWEAYDCQQALQWKNCVLATTQGQLGKRRPIQETRARLTEEANTRAQESKVWCFCCVV